MLQVGRVAIQLYPGAISSRSNKRTLKVRGREVEYMVAVRVRALLYQTGLIKILIDLGLKLSKWWGCCGFRSSDTSISIKLGSSLILTSRHGMMSFKSHG